MTIAFSPHVAIPLQYIAGLLQRKTFGELSGSELMGGCEVLLVLLSLAALDNVGPASGVGDLKPFPLRFIRRRVCRHVGEIVSRVENSMKGAVNFQLRPSRLRGGGMFR